MKVAIIGTGKVAQALAKGFAKGGHEITFGSRDPATKEVVPGTKVWNQKEAVQASEVVVLAVPYKSLDEIVNSIGAANFAGKTVVDVTNVMGPSGEWAVGFTTSAAEDLAKQLPEAHVVKAFNTVFAKHMSTGRIGSETLALLVAGDDAHAKETVMQLGKEIGFEPVDAGSLRVARYLEPMGLLNITLAFFQKMGPGIGFRIVRSP